MWCHLLLLMPLFGLGLFVILPLSLALPAYLIVSGLAVFVYWSVFKAMHRPVTTGRKGMVGTQAVAVTDLRPYGRVRHCGELWQAVAEEPVEAGSTVTIVSVRELQVKVQGEK